MLGIHTQTQLRCVRIPGIQSSLDRVADHDIIPFLASDFRLIQGYRCAAASLLNLRIRAPKDTPTIAL